jgi:acetyl esterase
MTLHPDIAAAVHTIEASGLLPMSHLGADRARAQMRALTADRREASLAQAGPIRAVRDSIVDRVPVRTYLPEANPEFVLVYMHGGGWVVGDLETIHPVAAYLCNVLKAVVVSVGYRLAPEHVFPAALDDSYAVLVHTAAAYPRLPLVVGGDSAGGNLAAGAALKARDENGPPLSGQLLVYPFTDPTLSLPSLRENGTGYFLLAEDITWFRDCYLPNSEQWTHQYAGPLHAADLSGLPPAVIMTAEFDPIRDDGDHYATRLREAGVPVAHTCITGYAHGFLSWFAVPSIKQVCDELLRRLPLLMGVADTDTDVPGERDRHLAPRVSGNDPSFELERSS